MHQNFENLLYQTSAPDVSYQIQYYEFPTYDDLYSIFGSTGSIKLQMMIIPYFLSQTKDGGVAYQGHSQGISANNKNFVYNVLDYVLNFEIQVPERGFITAEEVAQQIKQQFTYYSYYLAQGSSDTKQDADFIFHSFFNNLTEFSYDSNSGKFMFMFEILKNQVLAGQIDGLDPQVSDYKIANYEIVFLPSSSYSQYQQKLAADVMGSFHDDYDPYTLTYVQDQTSTQIIANYYSSFKTEFKLGNQIRSSFMHSYLSTIESTLVANIYSSSIVAFSESYPRFCTSEYIYIHSSADCSYWDQDGIKQQILDILPRNVQYNQLASFQTGSLYQKNPMTKARLSSLKALRLELRDENGNYINLGKEFILKIAINFQ